MEHYEEWDVTIPPQPSRSRLYRLEPIGIGTPYIEGLTSYIVRLAREHHVSVFDLALLEVFPLFSDAHRPHQRHVRIEHTINGASPVTHEWVAALKVLTSRDDLEYVTFIPRFCKAIEALAIWTKDPKAFFRLKNVLLC